MLLKTWHSWVIRCQAESVKGVARTMKQHWDGVLNYFENKLSNGFLEGINSVILAAKSRARGYHSTKNLINMAICLQVS